MRQKELGKDYCDPAVRPKEKIVPQFLYLLKVMNLCNMYFIVMVKRENNVNVEMP